MHNFQHKPQYCHLENGLAGNLPWSEDWVSKGRQSVEVIAILVLKQCAEGCHIFVPLTLKFLTLSKRREMPNWDEYCAKLSDFLGNSLLEIGRKLFLQHGT